MAAIAYSTPAPAPHGPVIAAIHVMRRDHAPIRLVSDNPDPQPESWDDRPRHTLVTFTLPQEAVDGAFYGSKNMVWAAARMMAALDAMRAGDESKAQRNIDLALAEMTSASAFADKLYAAVRRGARRTNRRTTRP